MLNTLFLNTLVLYFRAEIYIFCFVFYWKVSDLSSPCCEQQFPETSLVNETLNHVAHWSVFACNRIIANKSGCVDEIKRDEQTHQSVLKSAKILRVGFWINALNVATPTVASIYHLICFTRNCCVSPKVRRPVKDARKPKLLKDSSKRFGRQDLQ